MNTSIQKQRKKPNNRGFTLVEILVVIAILAVAAGMVSMSISLIYSRDAERCAKTINNALETARMASMSKRGDFTMKIDSENHTLLVESSVDGILETAALPGKVNITYTITNADISAAKMVQITFDKSTGKVQSIYADGTRADSDGSYPVLTIKGMNESGSKKASVVLVKATGKHYVEY